MNRYHSIKRKKSRPTRILFIALLFGLFSNSGFAVYSSTQKSVVTTEQVATFNNRHSKRSHSLKQAIPTIQAKKCFVPSAESLVAIKTLIYSQLIRVQLAAASKKTNLFERHITHFKSSPVPHTSDEDTPHSVRA